MERVRVRFAPSPTGPLHIGGARSALFNYLFAKNLGGDFVMRIEDTDLVRSSRESEENIKASLRWLGIDWTEGIDVGGPYAPYRQMERLQTYKDAAQQLIDAGLAYYCYCSEEEVEEQKKLAQAAGKMPNYAGTCRNLTAAQRAEKEAAGIKPVLRLRVDGEAPVEFSDLVRGEMSFERAGVGDFVIVKSDGIPVYNFACVVDDHLMNITHVLRGEEHLSNTPRQVVLYEALGWEMPKFGHISLILGKDRSKMSKRHGDVSCVSYQQAGYIPEALVNFLALLGWASGGEEEIFSMEQLEKLFTLDHVSKSPAVFDIDKLKWINAQYLHKLEVADLAEKLAPYVAEENICGDRLLLLAQTLQTHLNTFSEVRDYLPLFLGEEIPEVNEEAAAILAEATVPEVLRLLHEAMTQAAVFDAAAVKAALKAIRKQTGLGGAQVFMPVRLALTGCQHGPDLDKLAELMGQEVFFARLNAALKKLA